MNMRRAGFMKPRHFRVVSALTGFALTLVSTALFAQGNYTLRLPMPGLVAVSEPHPDDDSSAGGGNSCHGAGIGEVCEIDNVQVFYAGVIEGKGVYFAMEDAGQLRWRTVSPAPSISYSRTDGKRNTDAILNTTGTYPALSACRSLGEEWFLPAVDQLKLLSGTAFGEDANARLSKLAELGFQTNVYYWSSFSSATMARAVMPHTGSEYVRTVTHASYLVRCARHL